MRSGLLAIFVAIIMIGCAEKKVAPIEVEVSDGPIINKLFE